jgi:hypothetical protein
MFKDRIIGKGPWNAGEDEMLTHILKMTIKVFGVTRGNKYESKDT